jgi:hypothetical protein
MHFIFIFEPTLVAAVALVVLVENAILFANLLFSAPDALPNRCNRLMP